MRKLGVFEAKNKLSELIEQAEQGQTIVLTRNGKPVAELGPIGARSRAKVAAERILSLDWTLGESVVELVRKGRAGRP
ncbi:MAG TPA: type II toxin-antitoxin system prevent-host-death family antitoxin [Candidatus Tumulicola sp.]